MRTDKNTWGGVSPC